MTKQRFIVLMEKDEDGVFTGTVPSLKGCHSYGDTLDELMANVKEAVEAHLEAFGLDEKEPLLHEITTTLTSPHTSPTLFSSSHHVASA